jgi:hypothetical protein
MSAKARLNFWISPRSHPGHFAARFRLANRVQLTSDGHKAYLEAVEGAFGSDIDYAMLVKVVEGNPDPSTFQLATPPRGRVPASGFVAICRLLRYQLQCQIFAPF